MSYNKYGLTCNRKHNVTVIWLKNKIIMKIELQQNVLLIIIKIILKHNITNNHNNNTEIQYY